MNKGTTIALIAAVSEGTRIIRPSGDMPGMLWSMPSHMHRLNYFGGTADALLVGARTCKIFLHEAPQDWTKQYTVLVYCNRGRERARELGLIPVGSMCEALKVCGRTLLVIGGLQTFRAALPYADYLHFTVAHMNVSEGERFPSFDSARFSCLPQNKVPRQQYDDGDPCETSYEYHTRVGAPKWPE